MKNKVKQNHTTIEISVLMSVYKIKDKVVLEQAVDSILIQTYPNFEFLIYEDGCNQEEDEFLQKLAKKDARICLLRGEENKGLAYALNECLKVAKGTYIARMDEDDICAPERLQIQKEFLDTHLEYAFVGVGTRLFDEQGVWGIRFMPKYPNTKDFLKYSPYIHPSVMFRKSVLEQVGGYQVSKDTLRCEDYELFMRLYCMGQYGCNLQQPLFFYREDRKWYDKRTWKQRVAEVKIRYRGFRKMGILKWSTLVYVGKPVGMLVIPKGIRKRIRNRKIKNVKSVENVYSSGTIRRTRSRSGQDQHHVIKLR